MDSIHRPYTNVCKKCGNAQRDQRTGRCLPCYAAYKERNAETIRGKARAHMTWRREMGLIPRQKRIHEVSRVEANARRAQGRAFYKRHHERIRAQVARYRERYPDRVRTRNINQKARRRNAQGRHTTAEWNDVLLSYHGLCVYCTAPASTRDHVVPLAGGGDNWISNIVPACAMCNPSKGDSSLLKWLVRRGK